MRVSFCFLGLILLSLIFPAGRTQGVTIGSALPPDASAALDIQSTSGGLFLPRLTTSERNALPSPGGGLQIYNRDNDCVEVYFVNGGWKPLMCGCMAFPNATFTVPSASVNNPVTFNAPQSNATYSWTFQNGSPATATTQMPQVTWSAPGTYGVALTVTDSASCSTTHSDSVIISACNPLTLTFTNCGQTGHLGPSQSQCNAVYGAGVVSVSGGKQSWVVPTTGNYQIEVRGASGGQALYGHTGGQGAILQGQFSLTAGQTLDILVGQQGLLSTHNLYAGAGGGGGSFVYNASTANLLIVAGGGGGASGRTEGPNGGNASTGTSGNAAVMHPQQSYPASPGGSGGSGGNAGTGSANVDGAGGGGFSGNGGAITGGIAYMNGGNGGNGDGKGGFGGGGSSGINGNGYHGGGGGGYSGGGGGSNSGSANYGQGGGGGGSYNTGTFPAASIGNIGQGSVIITRVCP